MNASASPIRPSVHRAWMLLPTLVVAAAMLLAKNAWLAMFAYHGTMIVALVVHRRSMGGKTIWRFASAKISFGHLAVALLACSAISWAMFRYADQVGGYGLVLDLQLQSHAVSASTRIWFAAQLCLLNPLLEEWFWRGLFFEDRKRPALSDFGYAAFHFFALLPFAPAWLAAVATVGLVGFGCFLRQLAGHQRGSLVLPILWHVLGDLAVVVAIARLTG